MSPSDAFIGGGAFAKVFRVTERNSGKCFAMKVVNRQEFFVRSFGHSIDEEIKAMQASVGSKHVLKLFDVVEEFGHVYLRMELCLRDLLDHCNMQSGHRLPSNEAAALTRQLCLGVQCIHQAGFLHRDLKPDNLLLAADMSLRVADFGWTARSSPAPTDLAGTFEYMPPEVLNRQGPQTEAVDVWGVALTMLQMHLGGAMLSAPGNPPSTDHEEATKFRLAHFLREIYQLFPAPREARPPHVSHGAWDLFCQMLAPNYLQRASLEVCLKHPWLQTESRSAVRKSSLPSL